jgi:hypothetical protein
MEQLKSTLCWPNLRVGERLLKAVADGFPEGKAPTDLLYKDVLSLTFGGRWMC